MTDDAEQPVSEAESVEVEVSGEPYEIAIENPLRDAGDDEYGVED